VALEPNAEEVQAAKQLAFDLVAAELGLSAFHDGQGRIQSQAERVLDTLNERSAAEVSALVQHPAYIGAAAVMGLAEEAVEPPFDLLTGIHERFDDIDG
jgi:hypothetical protein